MTKLEKYYNYIVDDLVSKTKIKYSARNTLGDRAIIPFINNESIPLRDLKKILGSTILSTFVDHVIIVYGAQDNAHNNDVFPLWEMYRKRMMDKINNG